MFLFLPGEIFLSSACDFDPGLNEFAIERNVVLATPTTLITLLRTVACVWDQEKLAENAQKIKNLGRELYDRLSTLGEHFDRLRKGLSAAIDAYNDSVGALEKRVLVNARKFKELGAASSAKEIEELLPVEIPPRKIEAPELLLPHDQRGDSAS